MRSHAISWYCQKRIFIKGCCSIFNVALIFVLSSFIFCDRPALAVDVLGCQALSIYKNRVIAITQNPPQTVYNSPSTFSSLREYCHEHPVINVYGFAAPENNSIIIATKAIVMNCANQYTCSGFQERYDQVWKVSEIAHLLGCQVGHMPVTSSSGGGNSHDGSWFNPLIATLPQSPAAVKIPTIISKMAGEGSLASSLAVEIYSGIWQYLSLILGFKMFKFIRG
jgi:hypothetical protein